jgi:hypothetical protein
MGVVPACLCVRFVFELKPLAERRQRVVIDKSIQAAQQARGRNERGALAGEQLNFGFSRGRMHKLPPPLMHPFDLCILLLPFAAKQTMRSLESEVRPLVQCCYAIGWAPCSCADA